MTAPVPPQLVTLAETKLHLNIPASDTTQDAELAGFINAATPIVEYGIGPVNSKVIIGESHNGGSPLIMLFNPPIISVDKVTEYVGLTPYAITSQPLGSTVDNYGYSLESATTGKLVRRSGAGTPMHWLGGRSSVVVNYTTGRASIPADVRMAVLEDIRALFQQTQQGGAQNNAQDGWMQGPGHLFPRLDALMSSSARVTSIA